MFRLRLVLQNNIARTARPYACRDLVGKHADPPLLQCLAFLPRLCDRTKQPQTSRALHNVLRLPPESPAGQNSRWRANLAATSAVVSRESRSRQRSRGQAGYHNVLPFLHEIPEQAGYCTINPCTQLRMRWTLCTSKRINPKKQNCDDFGSLLCESSLGSQRRRLRCRARPDIWLRNPMLHAHLGQCQMQFGRDRGQIDVHAFQLILATEQQ